MSDCAERQAAERFRAGDLKNFGEFMTEIYCIYAAELSVRKGPAERMWRFLHEERRHIDLAAEATVCELLWLEDDPLDYESLFYQLAVEGAKHLMAYVDMQECFR